METSEKVQELLTTISELSDANLNLISSSNTLQKENRKLNGKVYAATYRLNEMMKSLDLYQQATSTLYTNVNLITTAVSLPECMNAILGSVKTIFKLDGIVIYYRTLGGHFQPDLSLEDFFNAEVGNKEHAHGKALIENMYTLNNLTLTQCNVEQLAYIRQTGNIYTSVILADSEPVFAIIVDRKNPITLHEMQLFDFLLKSYAVIINLKRRLMESSIISNNLLNRYGHAVEYALMDEMTKVYNQKGLAKRIESLKATPYCIVFFDLDKFKYVNDTFGHQAGDAVLIWFAQQLKLFGEELGGDVFRYGGDEFLAIFEGKEDLTSLVTSNLEIFIKNVREKVFVFNYTNDTSENPMDVEHSITTSIGVYYNQDCIDFEQAKEKADRALYASKSSGRNTVTLIRD
jgi:diguanylate cyclase (GGDEF)-like protein